MRTIQHIAVADEWQDALESGEYIWSTRGMTIEQVGYLHASFPEQVRPTLERFYADVDAPLVLLTLDTDAIVAAGLEVRVEPAVPGEDDSEKFPHVYGGALPTSCVSNVEPIEQPPAA
ncbi:DUF952 domain-containing protein [Dermacoccus nishinomiyaensis]|uniref:Uncharacterized protein n=1 Tax=Dermacoccus nishinomiyaensis TaxID=1274 RepID=A0A075JJK9_9MICO|nr:MULTISPECIES: DUF952 domain-containing protein [Dermacoccus]AIF40183.1 hypothetical protein HX89_03580 [Dermacoccus nishinomiyaensis]EFP57499.1 hypothetical protein HMPREF0321_1209 [Dermacoccus sp. Ellin185]TJZ96386.1 DUF952 domain-containing protein [Dermacoccus nishinomiyaensis]HCQ18589.1 DUF952 domain-containing protein [Dermacoccus sp.]